MSRELGKGQMKKELFIGAIERSINNYKKNINNPQCCDMVIRLIHTLSGQLMAILDDEQPKKDNGGRG